MRLHYKFKYELAQIADSSAAQERTFKIQLVWVLIFYFCKAKGKLHMLELYHMFSTFYVQFYGQYTAKNEKIIEKVRILQSEYGLFKSNQLYSATSSNSASRAAFFLADTFFMTKRKPRVRATPMGMESQVMPSLSKRPARM